MCPLLCYRNSWGQQMLEELLSVRSFKVNKIWFHLRIFLKLLRDWWQTPLMNRSCCVDFQWRSSPSICSDVLRILGSLNLSVCGSLSIRNLAVLRDWELSFWIRYSSWQVFHKSIMTVIKVKKKKTTSSLIGLTCLSNTWILHSRGASFQVRSLIVIFLKAL